MKRNFNTSDFAMNQAERFRKELESYDYSQFPRDLFVKESLESHKKQEEIEQSDKLSFDEFLDDYFNKN